MSNENARIVETTITFTDVVTEDSSAVIDLNKADRFSIEVTADTGDSIATLEASNSIYPPDDNTVWTDMDAVSVAEGASDFFEVPDVSYRWVRVTLTNDDIVDVSATCLVLVIGSPI